MKRFLILFVLVALPGFAATRRETLVPKAVPIDRLDVAERETGKPFRILPDCDPAVYDDPAFVLTLRIETFDPATGWRRGVMSTHTGRPLGKSARWASGVMAPPLGLKSSITVETSKPAACGLMLEEADAPASRPAAPAHRSIAFDEFDYAETASSADSLGVTGVAHDAGDLLVALASVFNTSGSTMTVSDPTNGTWTVPTGSPVLPDANSQAHIQYFENAAGGTVTVTFNPTGSSADIDAVVAEASGAAASGALDQYVEATGFSTTATLTTGTLAQPANIVFAIATHAGANTTLTTGSGWTFIAEDEDNFTSQAFHAEYQITSSTSAVTATVTLGGSVSWGIAAAVFKEASGAPSPARRRLLMVE